MSRITVAVEWSSFRPVSIDPFMVIAGQPVFTHVWISEGRAYNKDMNVSVPMLESLSLRGMVIL